jgi:phage terminase large subunit-like protein
MSTIAANKRRRAAKKAAPVKKPVPSGYVPQDPHVVKALNYARAVVERRIPACKWVIAACERQLSDLERYAKHDLYEWSEAHAGRVCRFIEQLPHVKGPKAGLRQRIVLEGWQCFALTTTFGWRRKDTGGRRFRRVYIEVPRGNAKSTLSSGVGLYCLSADNEEGAEVYSAATTRDQAKIVWGDAFAMLRKRADMTDALGIKIPRTLLGGSITHPRTNSKFEPLSRESGTMDGKNIHLAIIDELHAHKDRGVYDVIETGASKRLSSLIWVITTAGSDTAGICYEVRGYVTKILEGVVEDDSQFGIIYTLDEDDDWTDPGNWVKANPNWGVSVMPDNFTSLAQKAMQLMSAQNNFKTKHLNLWVNADVQWMEMRAWDRCFDQEMRLEDFKTDPMFDGLDLATKTDIASKARIFIRHQPRYVAGKCEAHEKAGEYKCTVCYPDAGDTEPHYYLFMKHYLPEAAIFDGRNSQYEGWQLEGWLTQTPGDVTDFNQIEAEIIEDLETFSLRECAYDPFQAAQMAQTLQDEHGVLMVEMRATVQNFSQPMKELEALTLSARVHHNGDPVMRWMVSNTVCHRDAKDNVYPRKEQPQNKIDGVVAAIMALARALAEDDPYASGGFKTL